MLQELQFLKDLGMTNTQILHFINDWLIITVSLLALVGMLFVVVMLIVIIKDFFSIPHQ